MFKYINKLWERITYWNYRRRMGNALFDLSIHYPSVYFIDTPLDDKLNNVVQLKPKK